MRDKIAFDLETTGVDTKKDRIVEICVHKKVKGVTETFHTLINPEMEIPVGASDVHGITNEMVKDSPTFKDVSKKVFEMMDGCDIVGYNSDRFDIPLIMNEFKRCGITLNVDDVCLIDVYKIEAKNVSNKLGDAYFRHIGKVLEGAHSAKDDTLATVEILNSQIKKFDLPSNFEELESYILDGQPRLDMEGKLKYIDGEICWTFGKNFNKPVSSDLSYLKWFMTNDIADDLRSILEKIK